MAGAFVDAHDGIPGRPRRGAEALPRRGVEPGTLVRDTLLVLDFEIQLMRRRELLGADAEEPVVDVHESLHVDSSAAVISLAFETGPFSGGRSGIGGGAGARRGLARSSRSPS